MVHGKFCLGLGFIGGIICYMFKGLSCNMCMLLLHRFKIVSSCFVLVLGHFSVLSVTDLSVGNDCGIAATALGKRLKLPMAFCREPQKLLARKRRLQQRAGFPILDLADTAY